MITQINSAAEGWWNWMWPMFWQVSVLVVLIGAADFLLRRYIWPQVRYALWLLVLNKADITADIFTIDKHHITSSNKGRPDGYAAYSIKRSGRNSVCWAKLRNERFSCRYRYRALPRARGHNDKRGK